MRFLTSDEMRACDRAAIAAGVPGRRLMARAGAAVARAAARRARALNTNRVLLLAGPGNNGGDACEAAGALRAAGFEAAVRLAADPARLTGDGRAAWEAWTAAGGDAAALPEAAAWEALDPFVFPLGGVVVDGLLGTGSRGAPRGAVAAAVRFCSRVARRCPVVSIDLPSGLDADSGRAAPECVRAGMTVTLACPKAGFREACAWEHLGRVEVADIGLQPPPAAADLEFIAAPELAGLRGIRVRDTHKGHYGRVLAIGGAAGLAGAPALAALGALRAGAGLVTAAVPHEGLPVMWSLAPEAMSHGLAAPAGCLQLDALRRWGRDPAAFDAVLAGPGMTAGQHTIGIVSWLLAGGAPRLLLDADGLNALAGWAAPGARPPVAWSSRPPGSLILTPHPGEAARLLASSVAAVQADRAAAARQLADRTGGVVVLKGCGTVVCGPGGTPRLNLTGNPGMASGGMGDVLAGVIAALWSRGLTALDAACLGVYLHGTAGDLAAWERSEEALLARDVADRLGDAFGTLEPAAERVPLPAAPDATR